MKIGGFQKCSLIDYPGKISSVIFTQGCNFRCYYCHNPELVYPSLFTQSLDLNSIIQFIEKRINKIDAVVFSGGEPTIQEDLPEVMSIFKKSGYLISIHTNGSNPGMLSKLFNQNLIDFISMDIKSSLKNYSNIIFSDFDENQIRKSISLIYDSGVSHEFRITFDTEKNEHADLSEIKSLISNNDELRINPVSYLNHNYKINHLININKKEFE
jgi:pyruvate formate lyase activating enzyme